MAAEADLSEVESLGWPVLAESTSFFSVAPERCVAGFLGLFVFASKPIHHGDVCSRIALAGIVELLQLGCIRSCTICQIVMFFFYVVVVMFPIVVSILLSVFACVSRC